jgi:hypothetical protein
MKRLLMMVLLSVLVTGVSGCSCGGLTGAGCGSPFSNLGSGFGNSQGILPNLSDGPVRRWLRGDSCDSCNVPSGQTSFDSGIGFNCESGTCNAPIGESVYGAPIPGSVGATTPVTTGYAPVYGNLPVESTAPVLDQGYMNSPYTSPDTYGDTSDGLVIPPLGN